MQIWKVKSTCRQLTSYTCTDKVVIDCCITRMCRIIVDMTQNPTCQYKISVVDTYQNTSKRATSLKYTFDRLPLLIMYLQLMHILTAHLSEV